MFDELDHLQQSKEKAPDPAHADDSRVSVGMIREALDGVLGAMYSYTVGLNRFFSFLWTQRRVLTLCVCRGRCAGPERLLGCV